MGEKTSRLMFYFLFKKQLYPLLNMTAFLKTEIRKIKKFVKEVTIFFFTYNVWLSISRIA